MPKTQILKYSHFFVIRHPTRQMLPVIYSYSSSYTSMKMEYDRFKQKKVWVPDCTFGVYVDNGYEFRFAMGQWRELIEIEFRNHIDPRSYDIVEIPMYEAPDVELVANPEYVLQDKQPLAFDFIIDNIQNKSALDPYARMPQLSLPTGCGKGVVGSLAAAKLNKRVAVVVLAGFVDKWIADLCEYIQLEKDDIGVIKGGKALLDATHWPSVEEPPRAMVFSLDTLMAWYKLYEESSTNPVLDSYGCKPWELWEHLGVGTAIYDEMHMHFYKIYRSYVYCHVPGTINLSATLTASDPVKRKIQVVMFPATIRFDKIRMKRYITLHPCAYQIADYERSHVRTTERGNNTYSHNAFEVSILGNKFLASQYIKMITDLVDSRFMKIKMEGDKCIIYVARKIFAVRLVEELRKLYPDLDINTFIEGQSEKNIKESDICVTTLISGSTGHDVKGLRVAINTVNVDSEISNLQALGRLREMRHRKENNDVHYYYLYCNTIPKHREYHEKRRGLFADRVKEDIMDEFLTTLYPSRDSFGRA